MFFRRQYQKKLALLFGGLTILFLLAGILFIPSSPVAIAAATPAAKEKSPAEVIKAVTKDIETVDYHIGTEGRTGLNIGLAEAGGIIEDSYFNLALLGPITAEQNPAVAKAFRNFFVNPTEQKSIPINGAEVTEYISDEGAGLLVNLNDYIISVAVQSSPHGIDWALKTARKLAQETMDEMAQTGVLDRPAPQIEAIEETPAPPETTEQPVIIFDTNNIYGVANGPTAPTTLSIDRPYLIKQITNYHWNKASGKTPGTIALQDENGKTYGPWKATGRPGQGGVPNAYWDVFPNIVLPPGTYTVIDSDPSSWAQNQESGGRGITTITAVPYVEEGSGSATSGASGGGGGGEEGHHHPSSVQAGIGSVGNIPGPESTTQAVVGVTVPGAIATALGALAAGLGGGGGLTPSGGSTIPFSPSGSGSNMPGNGETGGKAVATSSLGRRRTAADGIVGADNTEEEDILVDTTEMLEPQTNAPLDGDGEPLSEEETEIGKISIDTTGLSGESTKEKTGVTSVGEETGRTAPAEETEVIVPTEEETEFTEPSEEETEILEPTEEENETEGFDEEGYDQEGFNQEGFDREGYDRQGFDREGFNREGFDRDGFDREGYDLEGFNKEGFDQEGFNHDGFNREGFDREGYDKNGFDLEGFTKEGYDKEGFDREGFDREGFNRQGFDRDGYNQEGFDQKGFDREGFNKEGFDQEGFNRQGYDAQGFDREGFTKEGYNRQGYDREGYDRNGLDQEGYNREGFNQQGFDREGFNQEGFNQAGYDKEGFNRQGFDKDGFDRDGFNREGFDREGFNRDGFNREGYDRDGFDREGFDQNGYDRDGFSRAGFDNEGYDRDGYDINGLDRQGYDKGGYDAQGFDRKGYDRDGFDREGFDKSGYDQMGFDRQGFGRDGYNREGFDAYGYDREGYDKEGYHWSGYNSDGYNRAGDHWSKPRLKQTGGGIINVKDDGETNVPTSNAASTGPIDPKRAGAYNVFTGGATYEEVPGEKPPLGEPYPKTVEKYGEPSSYAGATTTKTGETSSPVPPPEEAPAPSTEDISAPPSAETEAEEIPATDTDVNEPEPISEEPPNVEEPINTEAPASAEPLSGQTASTAQTVPGEPQDGELQVIIGRNDNRRYEIEYDAKDKKWVDVSTGREFNRDAFEAEQDRIGEVNNWLAQEREKYINRTDANSRAIDEELAKFKQIDHLQEIAKEQGIGNKGGPGDVDKALQDIKNDMLDNREVDQEKLDKVKKVIGDRLAGKTEEDTGRRWEEEPWYSDVDSALRANNATIREVVSGEKEDGSTSYLGITAKTLITAATGGAGGKIINGAMTIADAMLQVKKGIDQGKSGLRATGEAIGKVILDEGLDRVSDAAQEGAANALKKRYPVFSKKAADLVERNKLEIKKANQEKSAALGLVDKKSAEAEIKNINKRLSKLNKEAAAEAAQKAAKSAKKSDGPYFVDANGQKVKTTFEHDAGETGSKTAKAAAEAKAAAAKAEEKILSDPAKTTKAEEALRGKVKDFDKMPAAKKEELIKQQAIYDEYKVNAEENAWKLADKVQKGEKIDVKDALDMKADPASMRTLKEIEKTEGLGAELGEGGAIKVKTEFNETLNKEVYQPSYRSVEQELSAKYNGAEIRVETVRTPGKEYHPWDVNTDNDIVAVRKVEGPNGTEWVEVPRQEWEDTYYKSFAQNTNFNPEEAAKKFPQEKWTQMSETEQYKKWAELHGETPTDVRHPEGAIDFSRQRTTILEGNKPMVECTPEELQKGVEHVMVDGKAMRPATATEIAQSGKGELLDAEQLGMMEKYKVEHYWNEGSLSSQTEALEQLTKTAEQAKALEEGYRNMGFNVSKMPQNMEEAIKIAGDRSLSPATRAEKLKELGFESPGDLASKLASRIGALRAARRK